MWEWSQQEFKKFRLISTKRNKRTEGLLADARVEVFTPSVSQCFQILVNRFQPFSTSPQPIQVYSEYIWIYPGSKTWFEHWFFFVVCFFLPQAANDMTHFNLLAIIVSIIMSVCSKQWPGSHGSKMLSQHLFCPSPCCTNPILVFNTVTLDRKPLLSGVFFFFCLC